MNGFLGTGAPVGVDLALVGVFTVALGVHLYRAFKPATRIGIWPLVMLWTAALAGFASYSSNYVVG